MASVPARVGLVGNPSDGFGGAVLAAVVDTWAAEARATPAPAGLRLSSPAVATRSWPTSAALAADADARDPGAPHAVVVAALAALHGQLAGGLPSVGVGWSTTIPRSVGLAGSSAIAIAVIEAVAASAGTELDPRLTAALALDAEATGMGIAAGWQDRMVQAHRGAVLVDAADMSTTLGGHAVPAVRRLTTFGPQAVLGWRPHDAERSDVYHGALRRRTDGEALAAGMDRLGDLARQAAACVVRNDHAGLCELVDASWRARRELAPLHPRHAELIEAVRDLGVVATSPGSGGSVVALPVTPAAAEEVMASLRGLGVDAVPVRLR